MKTQRSSSAASGIAFDFDYTPPFKFTGKLDKVTVELK